MASDQHQQQHQQQQQQQQQYQHMQQQQQQQPHYNPPSEVDRLWNLLAELSSQLSNNRQQTEDLHRRADELKTQAIHTQTGFTLRRFNVDISREEFESEVERLNVTLVLENQTLQQENRHLSTLLKDYEGTLETVMAKFRAHAHSTQQHHLDLIRHYEAILHSLPPTASPESPLITSPSSSSIDPLHLSLSLAHLASLIRKALRSLQGEDPNGEESFGSPSLSMQSEESELDDDEVLDDEFAALKEQLNGVMTSDELDGTNGPLVKRMKRRKPPRDVSEGGYIGSSASTSPHHVPSSTIQTLVPTPLALSDNTALSPATSAGSITSTLNSMAPLATLPAPLSQQPPVSTTGSTASSFITPGPSISQAGRPLLTSRRRIPVDEALERDIELETLRKENEQLRSMLGISGEV